MGNVTQKQYDDKAAEYRNDFAYLSDYRYDLLCSAAGENTIDIEDEEEALKVFGMTMDSFTQYTRKDIDDIC